MNPRYHFFPRVKRKTRAIMTFNSFTTHGQLGGPSVHDRKYYHLPILGPHIHKSANNSSGRGTSLDGHRYGSVTSIVKHGINQRSPSKCDKKYPNDKELVVALSTGWYNGGSRCLKNIRIKGHGKPVLGKVVDECDSVNDWDSHNGFRMPCGNNIANASPAVWKALGIPNKMIGTLRSHDLMSDMIQVYSNSTV